MPEVTDEQIARARKFHETYERLAPDFGYETRPDTKHFAPESHNGQLMIAVMGEIAQSETSSAARDAVRDFVAKVEGEDYWLDFEKEKFREVYAEMFNEEL